MKEATGELNLTVITIVAIGIVGAILAAMWGPISETITKTWANTGSEACTSSKIGSTQGTWSNGKCTFGSN